MASLGELGGGGDRRAVAPSGASQGIREKPGHFGQDGSDRRRIDRPIHGVPPGGRTPAAERKAAGSQDAGDQAKQLVEMRKCAQQQATKSQLEERRSQRLHR